MQRQFARMEVSFDFGATDSTFTTGDLGSEPLPLDDVAPGGTLVVPATLTFQDSDLGLSDTRIASTSSTDQPDRPALAATSSTTGSS